MPVLKRLFLKLLVGAAFLANTGAAVAAEPKNGVDYLTLPERISTDAGKQVEVTEFFAYYCGHCNLFDPILAGWVKAQGGNINFKRSHVTMSASIIPQQRLFFTLEAMNLVDKYHTQVFDAMHRQRLRLNTDELVFDWAASAGIERAKFIDVYRSFGVQAKVRRADQMMASYRIDQWPMIAIDGRFLTSPYHAGRGLPAGATEAAQQQRVLEVMDYLVAKAKAENN